MAGIYTFVGTSIDNGTATWITSVSSRLVGAITPIVLLALTIWVMWYGYRVMTGLAESPVMNFLLTSIKISLVLGIALGVGNYQAMIVEGVQGFINGMAQIFWPGSTSLYSALDSFDQVGANVAMILWDRGSQSLPWGGWSDVFAGTVVFAAGSLVAVFALFVTAIAKMALVFLLAIGPAFIACLAFQTTAQYFDKWVSKVLNFALLQAMLAGACSLFMQIAQHFIDQISNSMQSGSTNQLADAFDFLAVCAVLAIVIQQLPHITSGLMGGLALNHGLGMARQMMGNLGAGVPQVQPGKRPSSGANRGGTIIGSNSSSDGSRGVPAYRRASNSALQQGTDRAASAASTGSGQSSAYRRKPGSNA
ncbi:type IV secretion system protein [Burkholderia pyrrocinia]